MPGFDGTGPQGMGPMTGRARGFCGSRGIAVRRPYGYYRGAGHNYPRYGVHGFRPYTPPMTKEQELDLLKTQTQALKEELGGIEARIGQLSSEKQ